MSGVDGTPRMRLATADDAEAIRDVYAPFVRDTPASFEVEPPTVGEMCRRVTATLEHLPWLVCVGAGGMTGYAYASAHRARAAYSWSVDVSVYIRAASHRRGIGRGLYGALLRLLRLQGYCNAYAGITLPNAASVGLHEAVGFRPVGVYEKVGYKAGAWHDVGWWQLALGERPSAPEPPLPLTAVEAQAVEMILRDVEMECAGPVGPVRE